MCKPGNGTIFRECREEMFKAVGTRHIPNQEMRRILAEHKGCMNHKTTLDKKLIPV